MESLPPEAPMATRSPGKKRALAVMVLCISVSKMVMKHVLQSFWLFLGRLMRALEVLQSSQGGGAMPCWVPLSSGTYRSITEWYSLFPCLR